MPHLRAHSYLRNFLRMILYLAFTTTLSCKSDPEPAIAGWVKYDHGPVLQKGQPYDYDFYVISDCWVMFDEGKFKMWYTAGGAVLPDETLRSRIAYATSDDGIEWIKYTDNPVMDVTPNAWDSIGVETVSVIRDDDAPVSMRYKMWYAGQTVNEFRYDIGYAFSPDGIHWQKHTGPVMTVGGPGAWDNCFIEGPSVVKVDGQYKMWYAGYDCEINGEDTDGKVSIGYATSSDGISWTKKSTPVLKPSRDEWDKVYVQDPHVIYYQNTYHMWYGGADVGDNYSQQTGYAYSADGINWTKSNSNPVLRRGTSGSWDANTASFPTVIIHEGQLRMWYTGKDVEPLPEWPTHYYWEIGAAGRDVTGGEELD